LVLIFRGGKEKQSMKQKIISIVTLFYNEVDNIELLIKKVKDAMRRTSYDYEHIIIDNCSIDGTIPLLKKIAKNDKRVKLILNTRNFGDFRAPVHAILQSQGDACISIPSDMVIPPGLIVDFLNKWEAGYKIVFAVKSGSDDGFLMKRIRALYYKLINQISDTNLIQNATGNGLYDKEVIDIIRHVGDPSPYLRGFLCEIGFPIGMVPYHHKNGQAGAANRNWYDLYDMAMLGIVSHSKLPLRIMTVGGFIVSLASLLCAFLYLFAKIIYWDTFSLGLVPMLIGIFFFGSVQTFFLGILGEYVISIHTQIIKIPLVIESERINFD